MDLGTGFEIKIKDLDELVAKPMNFRGEIVWDGANPDGQPRRMLDVTRAEDLFRFRAGTRFEGVLRKTIDWYISQQENK